jgi:hypothetical protein
VAQDQRVEFLFAAQVTGQNQLEKLTQTVDKLRQETEQLKNANTTLASSTDAVIRNGVRYNNALDAQSKSLRQARQGTQQLGMQINDFATSVSTGASPIQAFNQQIGQVGYAMSMMGGTAGKVGAFLAGPWGAAITIATMVLGEMISGLLDFAGAAEDARKAADDLAKQESENRQATLDLIEARFNLGTATKENIQQYKLLQVAAMAAAQADMASASAALTASLTRMKAAQKEASFMAALSQTGPMGKVASMVGGWLGFGDTETAIKNVEEDTSKLTKSITNAWQKINAVRTAGDNIKDDKKRAMKGAKDKVSEAEKEAKRMREAYLKEQQKAVTDFMDLLSKANQKTMTQYQRDIYELQGSFNKMGMDERIKYQEDFNKALGDLDIAQIARDNEALNKSLKDGVLPQLADTLGKITPLQDAIVKRNEEMQSSFEAIGNSVSEAFKGMLTGAMSWKEGMRGIIGAVINELWRLFVVQQIVGFVSKALGGLAGGAGASTSASNGFSVDIGGGPSFRANGGSVMSNSPYIVGERGPELFVPNGNGTIIPNRNLGSGKGGSGMVINVDARGSADPAAVRAQVQQGILEAAPAIIAAAEARTVGGLRRPRLGGVIQ